MSRRTLAAIAIGLAMTLPAGAAQKTEKPTVRSWLATIAKLPFVVYQNLSQVRASVNVDPGSRLMVFDTASGIEAIIWNCESCWSPMPLDADHVAVLTRGGIEVATVSTKLHAVKLAATTGGDEVIDIIQPLDANRLLVAVRRSGDSCSIRVRVADLGAGKLVASDAPSDCLDTLAGVVKPAWIQDKLIVGSTRKYEPVAKLMVWPYSASSPSAKDAGRLLSDTLSGVFSRYDPVWLDRNHVVYLQSD